MKKRGFAARVGAFITGAVFLLFAGCAGGVTGPGQITLWGGDSAVPVLLSLVTVSGTELEAVFSAPVTVNRADVSFLEQLYPASWQADGDSSGLAKAVKISFIIDGKVGAGEKAIISASVSDTRGNSLSFAVPFTGFNSRPAGLILNEVRFDYSKPKVEYIEFLVTEAGNLAGIEIGNAMNDDSPVYEFPPAEVAAGDFIVWHLRSVEEGLIDETGSAGSESAIDTSAGTDSRTFARDFWSALTSAPLKENNVILVRERSGGRVMDALLCAASTTTAWANSAVLSAAEEAVAAGAWKGSSSVGGAACTDGVTPTRTLARLPGALDTDTAADWVVCLTGKCSPGAVNWQP